MAKVKIERRKPVTLAYIEHVGDYGAIPFGEYFERLYGWARENRVRPGMPFGIFHDRPGAKAAGEQRSEIAIPIFGDAKPQAEIRIRSLPAMDVATISHRGPAREYPATYRALNDWIEEKGYEWSGPSMEVYSKKPEQEGEEMILFAKILAPIRRKG